MRSVVVLCLLGAVVSAMVPGNENHELRRLVAWVAALTVLVSIFEPIVRAADQIIALPQQMLSLLLPDTEAAAIEKEGEGWVLAYGKERLQNTLRKLLAVHFSLDEEEITAALSLSKAIDGTVTVTALAVTVEDGDADTEAIRRYAADLLGCPCEVNYRRESDGE